MDLSRKISVYLFFSIPVVFFLKHNIATLLIALSPIIFFINFRKYKKFTFSTHYILHIFFIYIFLNGVVNKNLDNFLFLRCYFFLIIINYYLTLNEIDKYKKIILIFIIFVLIDTFVQYYFGFNLIGLNLNKTGYVTSFFNDEKILGSFLFKLYALFLIISFYFEKDKNIFYFLIFVPVSYLAIILSGQRIAMINFIFLILISFIYYLIKFPKKTILPSLIILCLSSIFALQMSDTIKKKHFDRVSEIFFTDLTSQRTTIYLKNTDNFSTIELNENVLKKSFLNYTDIFGYGIDKNRKENLSIEYFFPQSKRLKDVKFSIDFKSPSSIEIGKYYQINHEKMNFVNYLDYYNENNKLKKNQEIISFKSKEKIERKLIDNAWIAHSIIAFNIFKDYPLFGVGIKKYRHICYDKKYRNFDSFLRNWCTTHPHNYFFEILSEIGLVGLVLFITMIFIFIKNIFFNDKLKLLNKISLILIILQVFNPLQITGRFFSSSESWFLMFVIILLNVFSKENEKKVNIGK